MTTPPTSTVRVDSYDHYFYFSDVPESVTSWQRVIGKLSTAVILASNGRDSIPGVHHVFLREGQTEDICIREFSVRPVPRTYAAPPRNTVAQYVSHSIEPVILYNAYSFIYRTTVHPPLIVDEKEPDGTSAVLIMLLKAQAELSEDIRRGRTVLKKWECALEHPEYGRPMSRGFKPNDDRYWNRVEAASLRIAALAYGAMMGSDTKILFDERHSLATRGQGIAVMFNPLLKLFSPQRRHVRDSMNDFKQIR